MGFSLDMDMGDLIGALTKKKDTQAAPSSGSTSRGKKKSSPYKNIILIGTLVSAVFTIFIFLYYIPQTQTTEKQAKELEKKSGLQAEIVNISKQAVRIHSDMNKSQGKYIQILSKFTNSKDLQELYQSISSLAANQKLTVLEIKEGVVTQPAMKEKTELENMIQEIHVNATIKGQFLDYMKFKQQLSSSKMMINIMSEKMKVLDGKNSRNAIQAELSLTIYAIDKQPFLEAIGK